MVRPVGGSVLRYAAGAVPDDPKAIPQYLREELAKIQTVLQVLGDGQLDVTHAAPAKPRDGMSRYADGTDWNPGSGEGIYDYYGGAWHARGGSGGGTTITYGTATIDFATGANEASVAVSSPTILAGSKPRAFIMADDTSVDHTAADHRYAQALIGLTCGTPTAGVGFTIYGRCLDKISGKFSVRWEWA